MSNGEIIDFNVLRIQAELDKFNRTDTIPHTILEGIYDIDEIKKIYIDKLPPKYKKIANRLLKEYYSQVKENITQLKETLRNEYLNVMNNLYTDSDSFRFRIIESKYRGSLNPVKALYYETREITRSFDSTNEHHIWLKSLVTDVAYNNIILDALGKDIANLEKIIKRFYFPIVHNTNNIPLELVHAKTTIKDFRHYYQVFKDIKKWDYDEE